MEPSTYSLRELRGGVRLSGRPLRLVLSLALVLVSAMPAAGQRDRLPLNAAAIRAAAAGLPRLRSLLVSRHGTSLFEYYAAGAGPARVANVKSVSKSIISTLVGIAIDRRTLEGGPPAHRPIFSGAHERSRSAQGAHLR
jgi:hypothetical protein